MASWNRKRFIGFSVGVLLVLAAVTAGRTAAFHFLPPAWTGEAARLAKVLELAPGAVVADIGAGDGELAIELARVVGSSGVVYATEMTEEQRTAISEAARAAGATQLRVMAAAERTTGLPAACCDAVYLRTVLHHIADRDGFARELRRLMKPDGRLAIIYRTDFSPGTFFHLAGAHGTTPEQAIASMTAAGFRLERRVDDWGGRLFLLVFRPNANPEP